MKKLFMLLKRSVSPVFITLFVASFILWYIAKLSYTYTADYTARLSIVSDDREQRIEVPCVVEGSGTNLLNYKFKLGKRLRIPLSELETVSVYDADSVLREVVSKRSLRNAISVRMSDVKIVGLGEIPMLDHIDDEE